MTRVEVVFLLLGLLCGCSTTPKPSAVVDEPLTPGLFLEDFQQYLVAPEANARTISSPGLELTKLSEGFRSELYDDAAHYCSIAYGHLLKKARCDGTEPERFRRGLSEAEGSNLLSSDMRIAEQAVTRLVTADMNISQYSALCDFVYNVGITNFRTSTLLVVINGNESARVPRELRRWVLAGGREFRGLRLRREGEIALYFDGQPVPEAGFQDLTPLDAIDIRTGEVRQ